MNQPPRPWKTRHNGAEYGPYTDAEMSLYVDQQRISSATEVQHPRLTQGLWLKALAVQPLRERIERSQIPPVQAATQPNASPEFVAIAQSMQPSQRRSGRRHRAISRPTSSRGKHAEFRWILAGLWGTWFLGLAAYFLLGVMSYDQTGNFGVQTVYYTGTSSFPETEWISLNIWRTAIVGAMTFVPLTVVSVITYFFTVE